MKYLVIEHDGNGGIDRSGVHIEEIKGTKGDIQEAFDEYEYTQAMIPLSWVKDKIQADEKKQKARRKNDKTKRA